MPRHGKYSLKNRGNKVLCFLTVSALSTFEFFQILLVLAVLLNHASGTSTTTSTNTAIAMATTTVGSIVMASVTNMRGHGIMTSTTTTRGLLLVLLSHAGHCSRRAAHFLTAEAGTAVGSHCATTGCCVT